MSNFIRANWIKIMVVLSILGAPLVIFLWFLNNGIPMFTAGAPRAYDMFFEKGDISDLTGGGTTWLDYDIDLRFKATTLPKLKRQRIFRPGTSIVGATDELLRHYPEDADNLLNTSELEYWSHYSHGQNSYLIRNKRTNVCFFHAES